jgi:hypothetical protein
MNWRRDDASLKQDHFATATEYYSAVRKAMREKADHNKWEAQYTFYAIICFTLAAPLFVTLGDGWVWGKLIPATLSVSAAGASAWLQLRKPQRLWAMYRRAQRELEREKAAYDFDLDQYGEGEDKNHLLAERVSEIAFRVHEQWEGLVPDSDGLVSMTPSVSNQIEGKP